MGLKSINLNGENIVASNINDLKLSSKSYSKTFFKNDALIGCKTQLLISFGLRKGIG
jgi:hypothetical protein